MKRTTAVFLALVTLLLVFSLTANASSATPLEDFEYACKDAATVLLTRYIGSDQSVVVADRYYLDGVVYHVELASLTVFAGNTGITSVTLHSGVTFENNSMKQLFAKCSALQSVIFQNIDTSSVTDMSYLFYGCEALESLDLSVLNTSNVTTTKGMFSYCAKLKKLTGYENWDTRSLRSVAYMFNQTGQLAAVDLSRWSLEQLENSAWCFQSCGAQNIYLPDNLAVMSAGFLNHVANYAGSSFTIPSGVKKIGYAHTIYDFGTAAFNQFRVAEGNTAYQAVDGILYSADGTQMLAIPRGKTFPDGVYEIPEGVTFLGELSFSRNYNVETLILPDSYSLKYIPLYDPSYITFEDTGNLNAGLNLNIAIYSYTGIKAYEVKDTNPNYKSLDGILYTKDGTSLMAVPTRYEGAIKIPEGVTTWEKAAMWDAGELVDSLMKKCTGVSIPASMTEISQDQLDKLNRLEKRYSGFRITVSEDNPVYYTGKSGQLLKKPDVSDLQITLSQETFIYDGQPKTPLPTIVHNGKTLTEGTDYTLRYWDNVDAGTGWVQITGQGMHYGTVERAFTIEKAQPEYITPQGLTATYGQTLKDVTLPEGFTWTKPQSVVGDTGINSFAASFANGDPNYAAVTDIAVPVQVLPKKIGSDSVYTALWHPWTGKLITPSVTVVDEALIIPPGEYALSYENTQNLGKGKILLQDVPGGNYEINASVEFYIVPGPMLCVAVLTFLWCITTGVTLMKGKKAAQSEKPQKNR